MLGVGNSMIDITAFSIKHVQNIKTVVAIISKHITNNSL